jgi:hypothetical protein
MAPGSSKRKLGLLFLFLSFLLYGFVIVIPFLGFSGGLTAVTITSLIISAELSFLVSIIILGRQLAKKYRSYINPKNWIKKNSAEPETIQEEEKNG